MKRLVEPDFTEKGYNQVRGKLNHFEKERQEALSSGDIRKYFSFSLTGGFEIEPELIETYPLEYSESIGDYGKHLHNVEVNNDIRHDYLKEVKQYPVKKVFESKFVRWEDQVERDRFR